MAENVDDILEIHVNDSDESFDVNNCNELNMLFGETQFSVSQVLKRSATTATSASGKPQIKVITKLPNSEQSYKGKVKTHNYINRQNQSTTGKL
jgi:hypothetical protein